jgi:hypothetical protein
MVSSFQVQAGVTLFEACQAFVYPERSVNQYADKAYCNGYLSGLTFYVQSDYLKRKFSCMPDGVTPKQLARIFVEYVESHPENMHKSNGILFTMAMTSIFPCTD